MTVLSYTGVTIGYLNKLLLFPNFLKTEEVGLANILISIALIYAQVAALGTNNIILRFFPFFKNDRNRHNGFLFWIILIAMIGFLLVTLLFILFHNQVAAYYSVRSSLLIHYYYYVIPLALAFLVYHIFDNYLRSLLKTIFSTFVYDVLIRLFTTLSITGYILKLYSFEWFVVVYVSCFCLCALTIIIYTYIIGHLFLLPTASTKFNRLKKVVFQFGFFSILSNISSVLISNVDALMIAGMIGLDKTGIYLTITYITGVLLVPYRAIMKISSPIVAWHWKKKDMKGLEVLYKKVTINNLIIGGFLFVLLWINMDTIFSFMPSVYREGRFVFLFLGIGKLFDMITGLNGAILVTSRKYRFDMLFSILLIFLTITTNYLLIPPLGINGAAIAAMFTLFVYHMLRVWLVYRWFGIHPFTLNCLWVIITIIITGYIAEMVIIQGHLFIDSTVQSVLLTVLFFLPVYFFRLSEDIHATINTAISHLIRVFNPRGGK